jgi:hypothetical protein
MKEAQIETVGKVFIVIRGMRRCLICDCVLPPTQAANHARTPCYPRSKDSANGAAISNFHLACSFPLQ